MTRLVCITLVLIAGSALGQTREPPPIYLAPVIPPGLKLLAQPAVQADVGLTAKQKAELTAFHDLQGVSPETWALAFATPDMAREVLARLATDFLTKSLTKEQRLRLDQIVFQLREKEFGAHAAFAMAARDLGLRGDQLEDVQNLKGERVEEIVKHVTSGERYEKVKDRVAATNGETFEKMAEMLTRTQRERLKELKGKPFTGKVEFPVSEDLKRQQRGGGDSGLPLPKNVEAAMTEKGLPTASSYPVALFGTYDLEVRYLATPELRAELRVNPDQAKKLDAALEVWSKSQLALPGLDLDRSGQLHEQTAKILNDHLSADQRKRFDQIMMRRRLLAGPEAMCGYPAAVAALKLSPIQLQQLKDGKPVGLVLTRNQMAALDDLIGEPFKLPAGVVDPLLTSRAGQPDRVLDQPDAFARNFLALSNRLKLSEDQIKKLRELAEDEPKIKDLIRKELSLSETPPVVGAARGMTADQAVMDRYQAAVEEQCWNVLDAQQQSLARKIFGRGR